jgi:hypothetical protein
MEAGKQSGSSAQDEHERPGEQELGARSHGGDHGITETTGSAAWRAATLARLCRMEGGYARPTLPHGGRLRSPDSAVMTLV